MRQAVSGLTILFSICFMGSALVGQEPRLPDMPSVVELEPATLTLSGISSSTATLTAGDLYELPQQTVKTTDHGTAVIFRGVLLTDVLAKVKTPTGEAFNKTVASYYLVVEAADGYKAIFSWPEVDPSFTDRKLYIVTRRDGMPLSHKDGPFELIVPGEKRYSRWVRQVKTLRVEPLPTASAYDSEAGADAVGSLNGLAGDGPPQILVLRRHHDSTRSGAMM